MSIESGMNEWVSSVAISFDCTGSLFNKKLHDIQISALRGINQGCLFVPRVLINECCIILRMKQQTANNFSLTMSSSIVQRSKALHILGKMVLTLYDEINSSCFLNFFFFLLFVFLLLLILFHLFASFSCFPHFLN